MSPRFYKICGLLLILAIVGCERQSLIGPSEESLETGWQQFAFGAFDAAISTFQKIAKKEKPASEAQAQALLGEATVWDLRRPGNRPERAVRLYQSVIDSHPNSEQAAWSALALVRQKVILPIGQTPNWAKVREDYQKVIDRYPSRMAAAEATILQQVSLIETFRPADARAALATLKKFTETHPQSYYLSAAHSLIANTWLVLGNPQERLAEEILALEILEKQTREQWQKNHEVNSSFVNTNTTSAVFKIANIAEFDVGDFPTARKYYERFIRENPTEKRNFYARQALERMDKTEAQIRAAAPTSSDAP